ncbi:hypothetical protein BC834DRAFT_24702 [Gloeopeniophorella convolvens]|nr:hypothetical protein BC834DRAFT_24702 [Gloeopeniophorella convolvens]
MSDNAARSYTNTSRRANRRHATDRKIVYKSVLGSPFDIEWPHASSDLQHSILLQLTALFDGVVAYHRLIQAARRERKRTATRNPDEKHADGYASDGAKMEVLVNEEICDPPLAPPILLHMTVGINEVTKVLEIENRSNRMALVASESTTNVSRRLTEVVFICYADLDTPVLVAHLPQLVALCNSTRPEDRKIKVVHLPVGAQHKLASSLCLKRVSVLALDESTPGLSSLEHLLSAIPDLPDSLLAPLQAVSLEPSHIKQMLTSAPKDMKAAKERRMEERLAAKQRRAAKTQLLLRGATA